jgi:hypothetical protein
VRLQLSDKDFVRGADSGQGDFRVERPRIHVHSPKIGKKVSAVEGPLRIILFGPLDGTETVVLLNITQESPDEEESLPRRKAEIGHMIKPGPALRGSAQMVVGDETEKAFDPPVFFVDESLGHPGISQLTG